MTFSFIEIYTNFNVMIYSGVYIENEQKRDMKFLFVVPIKIYTQQYLIEIYMIQNQGNSMILKINLKD